jgi:hypothetical protein
LLKRINSGIASGEFLRDRYQSLLRRYEVSHRYLR